MSIPLQRPVQRPDRVMPASLRLISPASVDQASPIALRRSPQILVTLWRLADRLVITLAFVAILMFAGAGQVPGPAALLSADLDLRSWLSLLLFLGCWEAVAVRRGLYDEWSGLGRCTSCRALVCLVASVPMAWVPLPHDSGVLGLAGALMFGAAATLGVLGVQLAVQLARAGSARGRIRNVLIVGSGPRALDACLHLFRSPAGRYTVLGFMDDRVLPGLGKAGVPHLGALAQLESVLEQHVVDEVHIALPVKSCYAEFQRIIAVCERAGVECTYRLDTFLHESASGLLDLTGGQAGIRLRPLNHVGSLLLKRVFDITVAALGLFLLSPLMGLVALCVKLSSPGPVFFAQSRYGRNKRLFRMYKFRSMRQDAEAVLRRDPELYARYCRGNFKLPETEDPRMTSLGRFLRRTSIDELPQLWNVLRGEMAIVGPRPVVPDELVHYGPGAYLLLALKPGLTSSWVLGGRSAVGYPQRARLELSYVRNWSLWQDAWIFLKTVPYVLTGRGAY